MSNKRKKGVVEDAIFDGVQIGALWGSPIPQIHIQYTQVEDPEQLLDYLAQEGGVDTEIHWGYIGEGTDITRAFYIDLYPGRGRNAFRIPFSLENEEKNIDETRLEYLIDFIRFIIKTKNLRVYNFVLQDGGYFLGNSILFTWENTEKLERQLKFFEERLAELKKSKKKK